MKRLFTILLLSAWGAHAANLPSTPFSRDYLLRATTAAEVRTNIGLVATNVSVVAATGVDTNHFAITNYTLELKAGGILPAMNAAALTNMGGRFTSVDSIDNVVGFGTASYIRSDGNTFRFETESAGTNYLIGEFGAVQGMHAPNFIGGGANLTDVNAKLLTTDNFVLFDNSGLLTISNKNSTLAATFDNNVGAFFPVNVTLGLGGQFVGSGAGITNIPPQGIAPLAAIPGQVLAYDGAAVVWTNVAGTGDVMLAQLESSTNIATLKVSGSNIVDNITADVNSTNVVADNYYGNFGTATNASGNPMLSATNAASDGKMLYATSASTFKWDTAPAGGGTNYTFNTNHFTISNGTNVSLANSNLVISDLISGDPLGTWVAQFVGLDNGVTNAGGNRIAYSNDLWTASNALQQAISSGGATEQYVDDATNSLNTVLRGVIQDSTNGTVAKATASTHSTNFWGSLSPTNLPAGLSSSNFVGAFFSETNTGYLEFTAGKAYTTNINGNATLTAFAGVPNDKVWSIYLLVTNSTANNYSLTFPSGSRGAGNGTPPVYWVTNKAWAEFQVNGWGTYVTNINWSPRW